MKKSKDFIVRIIGDLPFYVSVPDGVTLVPSLVGEEFNVSFFHKNSLPPKGVQSAVGLEDGRGNLIFTQAVVEFPLEEEPEDTSGFLKEAIRIVNSALLSVKYVSLNYRIRSISVFEHHLVHVFVKHNGHESLLKGEEGSSYGPHGLRPISSVDSKAMNSILLHFQGLRPMYPSSLLLIDSQYSLDFDDYSRSMLDVATALEIHLPSLIEDYQKIDPGLASIEIEGMSIYKQYDGLLREITGHSLHEKPELFTSLEFIRQIRNSITHNWKPQFRTTEAFLKRTRYPEKHKQRDGDTISSKDEVRSIIKQASDIMAFATECFYERFGPSSL